MSQQVGESTVAFRVIGFAYVYAAALMYTALIDCIEEFAFTWLWAAIAVPMLVPPMLVWALFKTGTAYKLVMMLGSAVLLGEAFYLAWLCAIMPSAMDELEKLENTLAYLILLATVLTRLVFLFWSLMLLVQLRSVALHDRLYAGVPQVHNAKHRRTVMALEWLSYVYALLVGATLLFRGTPALDYTHFVIALVLPLGLPVILAVAVLKRKRSLGVAIFFACVVTVFDLLYLAFVFATYAWHADEIAAIAFGYPSFVLFAIAWVLRMCVGAAAIVCMARLYDVPFTARVSWLLKDKAT